MYTIKKTPKVSCNIKTQKQKKGFNDGFFDVDNPNNWIVNDGNGGVLKRRYYSNYNYNKSKNKKTN